MRVHDAWYRGDTTELGTLYGGPSTSSRPVQYSGGLVGSVARWFWGSPRSRGAGSKLHVPLARDLVSTSAALLFAEPPTISVPDEQGNDAAEARLDRIVNTAAVHSRLLEAGEVAAALGGAWLRCVWDEQVADHVMLDVVDADRAIGEWTWGRLRAVTFWSALPAQAGDPGDVVTRHLERHEPGRILHGLYRGDRGVLGRRVPLTEHPETAGLVEGLVLFADGEQGVETIPDAMTAGYVPNIRPAPRFRTSPALSEVGRSDLDGVEGLMDGLDETWSSLQRDIRLGKGRITVPETWLEDLGAGKGTAFDEDREVYSAVSKKSQGAAGSAMDPVVSQFAIRVDEHLRTAEAYVREAVRTAGYSPLTFGLADDAAATATEVDARERATQQTRSAKVRYWQATLGPLLRVLLQLDAVVFRTGAEVTEDLSVEFPPGSREPLRVRAETVSLLAASQSASARERVRLLHPDWDGQAVDDEVELVRAEQGLVLPDPIGDGETDSDGGASLVLTETPASRAND